MECPECEEPCVAFAVPADLHEYAPEGATTAAICPVCLRVYNAPEATPPDPAAAEFGAVGEFFPAGEAGVALALALGLLESLALNRPAIETLLTRAEREGADAHLTLDRLVSAGAVQPHVDLDRRRVQLEGLLD